jgi:hypothetical protein
MASDARTSITALQRGATLPTASFSISPDEVRDYLAATGDRGNYDGAVPPLAVMAFALRELQQTIVLPGGSLHTGQEVEHVSPVRAGDPLTMTGIVAQRSERQGLVITIIETEVASPFGPALRGRTTIMAPAGGG